MSHALHFSTKKPKEQAVMPMLDNVSCRRIDECTISRRSSECTWTSTITDCMVASSQMISDELGEAKLVSLHMAYGEKVKVISKKSVNEAVMENTGRYGSICFVIRRPGCGLCREEGWTLSTLTTLRGKPLEGFGLFGVVKETGVDDEGLADFQSFFPYPLYRDEDLAFYKAFGNRRFRIKLANPIVMSKKARAIWRRLKKKNIETNFKGEGFVKGGIIIFGADGRPMYAYEEKTGEEVPIDDLLMVADAIRAEYSLDC